MFTGAVAEVSSGSAAASNITQVGGTAITAGTSTPANSLPVTQAVPGSFFEFGGGSTGTAGALASHAITTAAFFINTGSTSLYIGSSSAVTADVGNSTSGYLVPGNGGQVPLFGNNTNLSFVIGSSTYAVMGS